MRWESWVSGRLGPPSILTACIVIAASCNYQRTDSTRICNRECARNALVELLDASTDGHICSGVVIATRKNATYVITPAHCLRGSHRHYAVLDAAGVKHVGAVLELDPRFSIETRNARHDLGVLEISGWEAAHWIPVAARSRNVSSKVTVAATDSNGSSWQTAQETWVTRSTIGIGDGTQTCFGSSGAAVLKQSGKGFLLAGLVSGGSVTCKTESTATRIDLETQRALFERRAPFPSGGDVLNCDDCVDEAQVGGHACESAFLDCIRDRHCSAFLEDFGRTPSLGLPNLPNKNYGNSEGKISRIVRCTCITACSQQCESQCKSHPNWLGPLPAK